MPKFTDIRGLDLEEIIYDPNLRVPIHSHEEAHFCLALQGECTEFYQNRVYNYRPGSAGFLPPNRPHSVHYHDSGLRWFRMIMPSHWFERVHNQSVAQLSPIHTHGGPLTQIFLRLHEEFRYPDEISPLVIEGLALEMLGSVLRQRAFADRKPPAWLVQARDFLAAHFREELNLTKIAETVDIHPIHLAREFRKHFNCTIGQFVRNKRVDYVCSQLVISHASLAEIALAAGFCDQSHLSRMFKRIIGMTPAEYRNASRTVRRDEEDFD